MKRAVACLAIALVGLAFGALAFGQGIAQGIAGLSPILVTAMVVMDIVTAYVFLGYYSTSRQLSVLFLGASYLFVALVTVSTVLTFPGMFSSTGLLGVDAQTVGLLWLCLHAGFPALVFASTLVPIRSQVAVPDRRRASIAIAAIVGGCALSGNALPFVLRAIGNAVPVVLGDGTFAPMAQWIALSGLCLLNAVVITRLVARPGARTVNNLWLALAVFALTLDSLVTLVSTTDSYCWYAGKLLGLISSGVVLAGYLREILAFNARLANANVKLRNVNAEERRRSQERLVYLAYHDELTDLCNRARWQELLRSRAERGGPNGGPFAVLFVDLDGFKDVNDAVGHARGDEVLIDAAQRLRHVLRPDDVVGRLGGDEFAILLPDIGHSGEASEVANRLLETMRQPFHISERSFDLSASIGIALFPHNGQSADALLHQSDVALYCAKRDGGNCYRYYTPEMGEERDRRRDLKHALARAVAGNEFRLHYQPLLDLRTGLLDGAEALIRWQDPEKGIVAPDTFIRIAEEAGLMQSIGRWALETTIAQLRVWDGENRPMHISTNISVNQLRDPRFFEHVRDTLDDYGVSPRQIRLEVTESAAMADTAAAIEVLGRCRALGIQIVLDDFGTHYSSLTYLQQLPIDVIKIDRSFVCDLPQNEQDAAIVRGIISLGHDLDRRIVAEGVETVEQLHWLRAASCDVVQGFLIERAMPAAQFATWSDAQALSRMPEMALAG
jgi:diguanylate cyclase (GGDEF)-like protein